MTTHAEESALRWNPAVPSLPSTNLIPNSSFELGADGWSSLGKSTAAGGDLCGLYGVVQAGESYDGGHCLRIELGPGLTPVTYSDYTLGSSQTVVQSAPLAASLGWMRVTPGVAYTLSAFMRADRDGVPADLALRFGGNVNAVVGADFHSKRVVLGTSWARYDFSMVAYTPDVFVALGPNLSETPEASAVVWIDSVQLEVSSGGPDAGSAAPSAYVPREAIELGLNCGRQGNLFDVTEAIGFTVTCANTTPLATEVELHAELEDYFGTRGPETIHRWSVAPGARVENFLPLSVPGGGYYRAHLSWELGEIAHSRTIKFSVVESYPSQESIFGLNHVPTTDGACGQLRKAGVTWARDWSMKWGSIEAREGTYDFAEIDRQVERIGRAGMNLLPLLPPQPSTLWASEAPLEGLPAVERSAYAPAPEHRDKLNAFIFATVSRYRDRVRYWEFLNEPLWVPWYCLPAGGGYTVDTYIELLKGASAAMKSADPNCVVIGGLSIMANSPMGDEFIQKGGLDLVDIYNLHPYPEGDGPESFAPLMTRILATMESRGARKPIWATELSYWGTDDKPWTPWSPPNPGHWAANRQQASEREASDFNIRQAVILLAHGVEKIFWHSGLEGEVNNGSRDLENPLLGPEAVPQKFFAAQAMLANSVGPIPRFAAPLKKEAVIDGGNTGGVHGYAFDGPRGAVLIAWAPGYLNDGNAGPGGIVPLGESPVYLISTSLSGSDLAAAPTLVRLSADSRNDENTPIWGLKLPVSVKAYSIVGSPVSGM
ncbi:MAG: hypothetical protein JNK74_28030 [Candidatus Hydrogenedentes bacterium]|nr:hypothetical protein [Candidatus Hydrogenedentota bacterium]